MEFYASAAKIIPPADMEMFRQILLVVESLPNIIFDPKDSRFDGCVNQVNCHVLCRALAYHFNVEVCDGYFTIGYQHTWLASKSGASIIDVYPVAGAAPFIVAADKISPWIGLYKTADGFLREKLATKDFQFQLDMTRRIVSETVESLNLKPLLP